MADGCEARCCRVEVLGEEDTCPSYVFESSTIGRLADGECGIEVGGEYVLRASERDSRLTQRRGEVTERRMWLASLELCFQIRTRRGMRRSWSQMWILSSGVRRGKNVNDCAGRHWHEV